MVEGKAPKETILAFLNPIGDSRRAGYHPHGVSRIAKPPLVPGSRLCPIRPAFEVGRATGPDVSWIEVLE
jgi:hypothetical protein